MLLVICTALPCGAATLWAVGAAYSREQASTTRNLRETTRALSLAVGRQLGVAEAVARTLGASPDLANDRLEFFYTQAKRVTEPDGGWAVLLDAQRMLLNTALPMGAPMPQGRRTPGSRLTNATEGRVDVSPMFVGDLVGRRAVAVTVAAQSEGKRYDISIVIPPQRIQQVLIDQRLPSGWIANVMDQKGIVVARIPDAQRWVGSPVTAEVREAVKSGPEGLLQTLSLDGLPTTAFYHRIPGSYWTLAIAVPENVLRRDAIAPLLVNTAIALGMLFFSIALALWMSRKLLAPAEALKELAMALEDGSPVAYKRQGVTEFDVVGAAMASAATRLTSANIDLQTRIEEAVTTAQNALQKVEAAQRQEALKRLTGGVAHDVNNMLAVISTSITLLEKRPDDPKRSSRFGAIKRSVANGRELTQKLLSFARQRTHDVNLLDLREWLPAQMPAIREKLGPESIIELDINSQVDLIKVDPAELSAALLNLAINAAQAMGSIGTLRLFAHNSDADSRTVSIMVADSGPGIADGNHLRIFEPFFTTGESLGRTGLGLSQVQSFCEISNGSIHVKNGEKGAVFTITLPSASSSGIVQLVQSPDNYDGSMLMLYVEDNVDVGEPTKEVLEELGYQVAWALTADAALDFAAHRAFGIVLSDYSLPGSMNGLELGQKLREKSPGLPFILLTGYAEQGIRAAAEGFDVLYKPCPVEQLEAALIRLRTSTRAT